MSKLSKTALLLLGHGSSKHPDSSRSVRKHAELLHQRDCFDEVHVAFLKEEPFVKDALALIDSEEVRILPDFLAEGYLTQQVIPKLLKLDEVADAVRYCAPVGTHPMMQELIGQAACDVLGDWRKEEVSFLLVGHGSTKNKQSKQSLLEHIDGIQKSSGYAQVADLWLEEPPCVSDWKSVASQNKVIVVPFLLNDGQHGGWDIPEMLGLERGVTMHGVTHELEGCQLRVAPSLGTSPRFIEVIELIAMEK